MVQTALRASGSGQGSHFSNKTADMFEEHDFSIIKVHPPCLRKKQIEVELHSQSKDALKENSMDEVRGSVEQPVVEEAEERSISKPNDDMINISVTFDSSTADEISRMHSFEVHVDDGTVESSLEISYENFVEFEQIRKERLKKIVEGSEVSEEAICGASVEELDLSDEDEIKSKDSKSASSKRSVPSKLGLSSNQGNGSVSSKISKRSASSSVSSKQSVCSNLSKRAASDNQGDTGVHENVSVKSKLLLKAFSKQDKRSVSSHQDGASATSGSDPSDHHDAATVSSSVRSIISKLSKRSVLSKQGDPALLDKPENTNTSFSGTSKQEDSSGSKGVWEDPVNITATAESQHHEEQKASGNSEVEKMKLHVEQIKVALLKRKQNSYILLFYDKCFKVVLLQARSKVNALC